MARQRGGDGVREAALRVRDRADREKDEEGADRYVSAGSPSPGEMSGIHRLSSSSGVASLERHLATAVLTER
jgi:hypothetical protein